MVLIGMISGRVAVDKLSLKLLRYLEQILPNCKVTFAAIFLSYEGLVNVDGTHFGIVAFGLEELKCR